MKSNNSSVYSKGNQTKWEADGYWYKEDFMGFESLAEYVVSEILKDSNLDNFVEYCYVKVNNKNCCKSKNFLKDSELVLPLPKLFRLNSKDLLVSLDLINQSKEQVKFLVDSVITLTGLTGFGVYLSNMLYIDSIFLNEDRHLNNIAVIYNKSTAKYRLCPIFDNGLALLSNVIDYPFGFMSNTRYMREVEAKPFLKSFNAQVELLDSLYPHNVSLIYNKQRIEDLIDKTNYNFMIKERVKEVLKHQFSSILTTELF
jgi:hypothetical protein